MKSKEKSVTGSRIASVHNGRACLRVMLVAGESNIRRYIIENDWLEATCAVAQ
ncbi:hypothetical protein [Dyadobacter helix]|uniref:hypothetical protein n=1 Tax=Dyadobacter helix TaxID=2822344 RepID=UPI001E3ECEF6|nr:hypothetical protein [Dyadobacter sp. CECT 9275]